MLFPLFLFCITGKQKHFKLNKSNYTATTSSLEFRTAKIKMNKTITLIIIIYFHFIILREINFRRFDLLSCTDPNIIVICKLLISHVYSQYIDDHAQSGFCRKPQKLLS